MIKGVFFDIDDTLYDSTKLTTMARRNSIQAMMDVGLLKDEDAAYSMLEGIIERFGSNYSKHYDELLKESNVGWNPKIIAAGVVAYERTKVGYLKPFPRVIPTLLSLKKEYKLGVISNGLAVKQWEKLVGLGIHHLFDEVVTSEEIGAQKPEKEIFLSAVDKLKLSSMECAMVGDKLDTDILGAKHVGMLAIRMLKGKFASEEPSSEEYKPDFEISDISEVPEILRGQKG
ncbi:MAG: TIGR02253 family HAD-type hydrolase [Candidatus Hydrothermarchaeales archaeon]